MRTACLILTLAAGVAAQSINDLEVARARKLLAAHSWTDRAWGAYLAGNLHSDDLKEPLLQALREAASLRGAASGSDEYAYLTTLLDAAIQSHTVVPSAVVEPFEEGWRAQAIILLGLERGGERWFLRLRAQDLPDGQWLAINNFLLQNKSKSLFALTLHEVQITHTFTLTDPGDLMGVGVGMGSGMCGDGMLAMPNGFPPIAIYEILSTPLQGDVLLAAGPENAYYRRVVIPAGKQVGFGVCSSPVDRQHARIEYLAAMSVLDIHAVQQTIEPRTRIEYRSEAGFRQQWDSALSAQEAGIRDLVRNALQQGWGGVAGANLEILPKVDDLRKTATGTTPALTPHRFVLE